MKLYHIYQVLFFLTLTNCAHNDDLVINENQEGLFYWDQTLCADPWGTGEQDSDSETAIALRNYLKDNDVEVIDLGFKNIKEEGVLTCQSCQCFTWSRIIVQTNEEHYSKIEELGFTKLNDSEIEVKTENN